MNISAYVRFTLKDKPIDYLGITGEDWNFGKDEPLEWHVISLAFIKRLADFYLTTARPDPAEFEEQARQLGEIIATLKVEQVEAG